MPCVSAVTVASLALAQSGAIVGATVGAASTLVAAANRTAIVSAAASCDTIQVDLTQLTFSPGGASPFGKKSVVTKREKKNCSGGWRDVVRVWVGGCDPRPPTLHLSVFPNVCFPNVYFLVVSITTTSRKLGTS